MTGNSVRMSKSGILSPKIIHLNSEIKHHKNFHFTLLIIYHISLLLSRMTTNSKKTNELRDRSSQQTQDADWVMVKRDEHLAEGFELIDAAEARCWCGGADAERCRWQGHTWPLCNIDQGELWPEHSDGVHYQSDEEYDETDTEDLNTTDDESIADDSKGTAKKVTAQGAVDPPASNANNPFKDLATLVHLLDKGRYPDA